ncbi:MAG: DUF134 domain-containing protein [Clostridiales bacterium]|nr:DUF134 domain-containing protein [Clostridiales bacterium]
MARPTKRRKVCCIPDNNSFGPIAMRLGEDNKIIMTIDEYETIRLIDLEDLTQEECAEKMHIARTTVQGIYKQARQKLADSLVNGKMLTIEGGKYRLCDESIDDCGPTCYRRRKSKRCEKSS